MAKKLKVLSVDDLIKIMKKFGFIVHDQSGSHVKLRRETIGIKQTMIVPLHDPITKGTLKSIFNQASKYVSQDDLIPHFYH